MLSWTLQYFCTIEPLSANVFCSHTARYERGWSRYEVRMASLMASTPPIGPDVQWQYWSRVALRRPPTAAESSWPICIASYSAAILLPLSDPTGGEREECAGPGVASSMRAVFIYSSWVAVVCRRHCRSPGFRVIRETGWCEPGALKVSTWSKQRSNLTASASILLQNIEDYSAGIVGSGGGSDGHVWEREYVGTLSAVGCWGL